MKVERIFLVIGIILVGGVFMYFSNMQNKSDYGHADARTTDNLHDADRAIQDKQLVFSEEFDSNDLDQSYWSTCYDWKLPTETGCTNHGNFERQWYTDDQLSVENGVLHITAIKKPVDVVVNKHVKSFDYQSGMINSGSGNSSGIVNWSGVYGYYEAKIKFDKGQGVWPAFWLLPTNRQWPPEIDIMEFVGSKPGEILQTLHWDKDGKPQKKTSVTRNVEDYSANWHTYSVNWQPDRIDWFIDGNITSSYTGPNIPDEPMEIILNLAIGGTLPGDPDNTTDFPVSMTVDYVRVYQSEEHARPVNN